MDSLSPARWKTITRSPTTAGPAYPAPSGYDQSFLGPPAGQFAASFSPLALPLRSGPGIGGQSRAQVLAETRGGRPHARRGRMIEARPVRRIAVSPRDKCGCIGLPDDTVKGGNPATKANTAPSASLILAPFAGRKLLAGLRFCSLRIRTSQV